MSKQVSMHFVGVAAAFVATLITANIVAVKLIPGLGPLGPVPAAMLVFPVSYIFGDILTEVYGYARARQVIWLGFACNLYAVLTIAAAGWLPGATGLWSPEQQQSYEAILGGTPKILAASFAAYLVGEFANSIIMARLKVATEGRFLWLRTVASTVVGQGLDSLVFIGLAFGPLWPIILSQWITKCLYEIVATPFTYWLSGHLKRVEGQDPYDRGTHFNPLSLAGPEETAA